MDYLPKKTLPVTRDELNIIKKLENAHFVVYFVYDDRNTAKIWTWDENVHKKNHADEMRVNEHDYFHYFGNVIDLAKYTTEVQDGFRFFTIYLGVSADYTIPHICDNGENRSELTIYSSGKKIIKWLQDETECKQKLIEHFTELVAKDMPMYNMKFIFS